jgi:hypothetical protein
MPNSGAKSLKENSGAKGLKSAAKILVNSAGEGIISALKG